MAFPPNYGQERRSREVAKQRKAREKQMKRDEKAMSRRPDEPAPEPVAAQAELKKDI